MATFGVPQYDFISDFIYDLPFIDCFIFYGGAVLAFNTFQRYVIIIPPSPSLLIDVVAKTSSAQFESKEDALDGL